MPIIESPDSVTVTASVHCTVCGRNVPLDDVTIGLAAQDAARPFVCSRHLARSGSARFLRMWVNLLVRQNINKGGWDDENFCRRTAT